MAVIEDVVRGSDGLIRAAYIRTKNGRTNRPIARLYPLEVRHTESAMVPEDPQIKDNPEQEVPQEQAGSVVRPSCKGTQQTSRLDGDVKGAPGVVSHCQTLFLDAERVKKKGLATRDYPRRMSRTDVIQT